MATTSTTTTTPSTSPPPQPTHQDLTALIKFAEDLINKRLDASSGIGPLRSTLHKLCGLQSDLLEYIRTHEREKAKIKEADRELSKVVNEIARVIDVVSTIAETRPDLVNSAECVEANSSGAASAPTNSDAPTAPNTGSPTAALPTSVPSDTPKKPVEAGGVYGPNTVAYSQQNEQRVQNAGPPEIPPSEIVFDKTKDYLGGGAFGSVYKANCRGTSVAVKVPLKQNLTPGELQMFRHEVMIMRKIFHPNVVLCLGACTNPGNLMIVTELLHGDLDQLIHAPNLFEKLTMQQKLNMARDAVYGMNWLHGICHILHRDLKPANLLIDEHNHIKVTDFGFSETLRTNRNMKDMRGPKGTALYMAPEVMRMDEFNEKADVYSFALILYELITGSEPFSQYTDLDSFFDAVCVRNERPVLPEESMPPSLVAGIKASWDPIPSKRPSFPELLSVLETSLMECLLDDPAARLFWRKHFCSQRLQDMILVEDFTDALCVVHSPSIKTSLPLFSKFIGVNPPSETIDTGIKVVTLERFGQFCKWFGPFFTPEGIPIYEEIIELLQQQWFHMDIDRIKSERRLMNKAEGTFLVRVSFNDEKSTPFTISKVKGRPFHKRVTRVSYDPQASVRLSVPVGDSHDTLTSHTLVEMINSLIASNNLATATTTTGDGDGDGAATTTATATTATTTTAATTTRRRRSSSSSWLLPNVVVVIVASIAVPVADPAAGHDDEDRHVLEQRSDHHHPQDVEDSPLRGPHPGALSHVPGNGDGHGHGDGDWDGGQRGSGIRGRRRVLVSDKVGESQPQPSAGPDAGGLGMYGAAWVAAHSAADGPVDSSSNSISAGSAATAATTATTTTPTTAAAAAAAASGFTYEGIHGRFQTGHLLQDRRGSLPRNERSDEEYEEYSDEGGGYGETKHSTTSQLEVNRCRHQENSSHPVLGPSTTTTKPNNTFSADTNFDRKKRRKSDTPTSNDNRAATATCTQTNNLQHTAQIDAIHHQKRPSQNPMEDTMATSQQSNQKGPSQNALPTQSGMTETFGGGVTPEQWGRPPCCCCKHSFGAPSYSTAVGNKVHLTLVTGDVVEGEIVAYRHPSKSIVLIELNAGKRILKIVNGDCVKSLKIIELPMHQGHSPFLPPGPPNYQLLQAREAAALREKATEAAKIGVNVTTHAQEVYNSLSKTLRCSWQPNGDIKVFDDVTIASPYTPETVSGPEKSQVAVQRVKTVLQGELQRIAARTQHTTAATTNQHQQQHQIPPALSNATTATMTIPQATPPSMNTSANNNPLVPTKSEVPNTNPTRI
ncbi:SHK1 protein [Pelomyxa schiedti]|nr:SHK1 protein [Pelomyxa schiedti]